MHDEDWGLGLAPRVLSGLAFLALAVSLWFPWWGVADTVEGAEGGRYGFVRLFTSDPLVSQAWTVVTGLLVVAATALLFLRIAGRSWHHEPRAYRRDLWVAGGLVALALASTALWPVHEPFWDTDRYTVEEGGPVYVHSAEPRGGWWTAAVGGALAFAAAGTASWRRHQRVKGGAGTRSDK